GNAPNFSNGADVSFLANIGTGQPVDPTIWSARIEWEKPRLDGTNTAVYPGGCLKLCATVKCMNVDGGGAFGVDKLEFEIFKFGNETNPLDPASTPPLRTISLFNVGACPAAGTPPVETTLGTFCANWDGLYNLNGQFGKTNGQFGFRATVETNQTSPTAGNISIIQTVAYPGQNQYPITVDVLNVHSVISTPTVVGRVTAVAAEPYNLLYRLSKEADVTIKIFPTTLDHWWQWSATEGSWINPIRTLVNKVPRTGEGGPGGTLTNGDFWDGRDDNGNLVSSGVYVAFINAEARDYFGLDMAYGSTAYFAVDPLQITDVGTKPLGSTSTDQAVISYLLTEPAKVHVGIYSPGTTFLDTNVSPPVVASGGLIRLISEQKERRVQTSTVWDGRDSSGNIMPDGDYVYAIWAELPSDAVGGGVIWTQKTMTGIIPVARGLVVSLISPSSTVIGSSPTASELAPFYFRYVPERSALFTMNILPRGSVTPVRHLSFAQARVGGTMVREEWDGRKDDGTYVSSGVYVAELIARDELTAGGVSTTSVQFSVNMFRIVDVFTRPLLGGTSDMASLGYELSMPMYVNFRVYEPGKTVNPSLSDWATNAASLGTPLYSISGMRPGRARISEFWDGRLEDGTLAADGRYPFTLTACTSTDTANSICAMDQVYGHLDVARGQIIFLAFDVIPNVPTLYNSSSPVTLPPYEIDYMLSRQAMVKVEVLDSDRNVVATVIPARAGETTEYREGNILYKEFWDGRYTDPVTRLPGDFVRPGPYDIRVVAQDVGTTQLFAGTTVQQTLEVNPLRIFDVAITPLTRESQSAVISYQVSEPMSVVTKIYRPGTSLSSTCSNLSSARDGCAASLVKLFAGVRPARTQIFETWDGTDRTLSRVPDGNYVFRIYGTTSTEKVSMLTGQLGETAVEVDDIIVSNLPVVNGPGGDDAQLKQDTFFAPNPYTGTGGWFQLPIYSTSEVSIKIYNLAGDLIYTWAETLEGGQIKKHYWPKVNTAGNEVKQGVYFAVVRYEGRDGGRGELQVVKKILIP
ncbi:MAG TPA: hypothetical protein PL037_03810, partial [Elusimicrobiales bacterium]|nr:hypothetical protein [Elusimicrobiales bacterium]